MQILQTIDQIAKDHFVLVIAHRLHTINSADLIVVLDKGQVADSGTHQELQERSPLYQELLKAYEEEETLV